MAIVRLNPEANPVPNTTTPETIQEPNKSIFTSLVSEAKVNSLLKYVEGYSWTVNYYGQLLNSNNTLENFDPTTPNLTQPYYKVNKLIMQVSSPLSSSYDQNTGITLITGSAIVPYKITPNVGDVFIAQVDSGEDAIFHITSVSRKTHRKDTLYEISYTLYAYKSTNPDFIEALESRINEVYYFNNDSNFFNRDVLIKPSVQEARDRVKIFLNESKKYYFSTFTQLETGSLLIPGIDNILYDPVLVKFIMKTVEYDYLLNVPFFQHTYLSKEIDQPSIFDALLNQSQVYLKNINKTFNFISSNAIENRARIGTVYHAGIDYILHPTNPNTSYDVLGSSIFDQSEYLSSMKTVKNYNTSTPLVLETINNNQIYTKPILHDLFIEDYYIVSKNFYEYLDDNTKYPSISYIEFLISKFIKKEAIAVEDLAVTVERYMDWSLLHQLYLLPVCWLLINFRIN